MDVIRAVETKDDDEVKKAFVGLLSDYLSPAFGSISKRDFDILLFMKLQELGAIDKNPEIYELVSDLRVTRAKARNLLYEAKLRASSQQDLDEELRSLMVSPIFLKDNDKIGIEVGNPYLIDHLRFKLKKLNHITDGSFSPELVKLTTDAYIALFRTCLPDHSEERIVQALVEVERNLIRALQGLWHRYWESLELKWRMKLVMQWQNLLGNLRSRYRRKCGCSKGRFRALLRR